MTSEIPADIRCALDYERAAQRYVAADTYAYIAGGSGHDQTLTDNRRAFAQRALTPRLFGDFSNANTRVVLPGAELAHPFLLAPVAYHGLVHPSAETATARAAAATDSCIVASTHSTLTLEQIASAAGPARWFQLYRQSTLDATLRLVRRAEDAGFRAVVLTVDAAIQVPSHATLASGFTLPAHCVPANLVDQAPAPTSPPGAGGKIFATLAQHVVSLQDIEALRAAMTLPLWIKGVLHADDALRLKSLGVAGLIVSNHGGRALDGSIASLDALPAIRAAVGPDFPLLLDGGVRSGADAFKAIALGADAVLVGRLQLYALAVAGALGVAHMLRTLREELEVVMAHTRCPTLADVRGVELPLRPAASLESSTC